MKKELSNAELLCEWCFNERVFVDEYNQELNPHYNRDKGEWQNLWIFEKFYAYTTCVAENYQKECNKFNFTTGHNMTKAEQALATHIADVWFGRAETEFKCRRDNKTALKLRNRITNQVVYMGWYDGAITVSADEPWHPEPWSDSNDKILNDK